MMRALSVCLGLGFNSHPKSRKKSIFTILDISKVNYNLTQTVEKYFHHCLDGNSKEFAKQFIEAFFENKTKLKEIFLTFLVRLNIRQQKNGTNCDLKSKLKKNFLVLIVSIIKILYHIIFFYFPTKYLRSD